MKAVVLPSEHVFVLLVNLIVISAAVSSLFHLLPSFFNQNAKLNIINQEVKAAEQEVGKLEQQAENARALPHVTARSQANLVHNSKISILGLK